MCFSLLIHLATWLLSKRMLWRVKAVVSPQADRSRIPNSKSIASDLAIWSHMHVNPLLGNKWSKSTTRNKMNIWNIIYQQLYHQNFHVSLLMLFDLWSSCWEEQRRGGARPSSQHLQSGAGNTFPFQSTQTDGDWHIYILINCVFTYMSVCIHIAKNNEKAPNDHVDIA